jgi:hypothetical protein
MMPDAIVTMSEKEILHRLRNLEQINEFLIRFLLDVSTHLDAALGEDGLGSDVSALVLARERTSRLRERIATPC